MNKSSRSAKETSILSLILFFFLISFPVEAQKKNNLHFPVTQFKLKNGLQVILSEDYSLPLVSVVVAYNVGSINEQSGKTGLAYLLENLMFQGSKNIGRMQHISFIHRVGGELNAATTVDKTIFYQTVPSNQLALVLWLESDRMISLDFDSVNVRRAKNALIEEIHNRKATEPYLESYLSFDELLFPDFAYSHPVFGNESHLRNISVEDVKNFYSTFYTPNNAVLCIAGNIERAKTEKLIRKYFENIPKGKDILPLPLPKLTEKKAIVKNLEDSVARSPGFHLGYRIASPFSADFYPLKIIEYILLQGKSSRLQKRLFKKERTVSHLSGGIEKRKSLAAFKIFVINNNVITMKRSQNAIFSEINKLKSNLISEKELRKSKNMFKINYINQYSTSIDRARYLVETFLSKNSFDEIPDELEKYLVVTPSDIIGIMNRYFTQESVLLNVKIK